MINLWYQSYGNAVECCYNVALCLTGKALFNIGLDSIGNIVLKKKDLIS